MSTALLMRCGLLLQLLEGWVTVAHLAERFAAGRTDAQRAVVWLVEHGYVELGEHVEPIARWVVSRDFCELWAEHFDRPCPIITTSRTVSGSPLQEVDGAVGN